MNFPNELKQVYREGRLLPFIGAGVSMSVSWNDGSKRGPSWSELVNKAAQFINFEDPNLLRARGTDLQILEYFRIIKNDNTSELTNWLIREINPPEKALRNSIIHKKLAELSNCHVFYTTNFDKFLEDAFDLHGRKNKVVAKEHDMCRVKKGECEIVKFHGDLNNTDMLVLSEADYEKRLSLSTELDYRLKADLLNRTVLFLGYSFRDPNVSYLFRTITEQFRKSSGISIPRAYIVVKHPSQFEKKLFNARDIEIIPANTDDLTTFISELLEYIKK